MVGYFKMSGLRPEILVTSKQESTWAKIRKAHSLSNLRVDKGSYKYKKQPQQRDIWGTVFLLNSMLLVSLLKEFLKWSLLVTLTFITKSWRKPSVNTQVGWNFHIQDPVKALKDSHLLLPSLWPKCRLTSECPMPAGLAVSFLVQHCYQTRLF